MRIVKSGLILGVTYQGPLPGQSRQDETDPWLDSALETKTWQRMFAEYRGHVRVYIHDLMWLSDWEDHGQQYALKDITPYWWTEGNASCDCNRVPFFGFDGFPPYLGEQEHCCGEEIRVLDIQRLIDGDAEFGAEVTREATDEERNTLYRMVLGNETWETPSPELRSMAEAYAPDGTLDTTEEGR